MYAPENQNSNERESAAQIDAQNKALAEAKRKLFEAVSAINALLQKTYDTTDASRSISTEAWLEALSNHELANRARDYVESALGRLNNISKGE